MIITKIKRKAPLPAGLEVILVGDTLRVAAQPSRAAAMKRCDVQALADYASPRRLELCNVYLQGSCEDNARLLEHVKVLKLDNSGITYLFPFLEALDDLEDDGKLPDALITFRRAGLQHLIIHNIGGLDAEVLTGFDALRELEFDELGPFEAIDLASLPGLKVIKVTKLFDELRDLAVPADLKTTGGPVLDLECTIDFPSLAALVRSGRFDALHVRSITTITQADRDAVCGEEGARLVRFMGPSMQVDVNDDTPADVLEHVVSALAPDVTTLVLMLTSPVDLKSLLLPVLAVLPVTVHTLRLDMDTITADEAKAIIAAAAARAADKGNEASLTLDLETCMVDDMPPSAVAGLLPSPCPPGLVVKLPQPDDSLEA